MNKKYEFTGNTIVNEDGVTLHQIRAVMTFGKIKAEDLGGFIEKESNLSHSDGAWVYGGADISKKKQIFLASNVGTEYGTLTVYKGKNGLLATRGCFFGTVEEFLAKSKEVHDDKTHNEYKLLIEVAKSRILG